MQNNRYETFTDMDMPSFKKSFRTLTSKSDSKPKKTSKMNYSAYWRLLSYACKNPIVFSLAITFALLSQSGNIILPYLSGKVMDCIVNWEESQMEYYCIMFLIALIFSSLSIFMRYTFVVMISDSVSNMLKNEAFQKFMSYDLEFFEKHKTGELLSRLDSDIATLRWAIGANISNFLKSIFLIIGCFIIMFLMNWRISLIITTMFPLLIGVSSFFSHFVKKWTKDYQDMIADTSVIAEECISNIKTVKAFAQEENEAIHFGDVLAKAYKTAIKRALAGGVYRSTVDLISYISILIVLWYGGIKVFSGDLSYGQLVAFLLYSNTYSTGIGTLTDALTSIIVASGIAEVLFDLFDYKPNLIENQPGGLESPINGNIRFSNCGFSYPAKPDVNILKEFNFAIKEGERIALCGSSGGGKSTLVNLMLRFYDIQIGELLIDGVNVKKYNLGYLRRNIGLVSQEPILFCGTIEQNIVYGLEEYTKQDLLEASEIANAIEFIANKNLFPQGFDTIVGEKGVRLSGGQKQRIAIARALIKKPKILIFDESTSALDAESEFQVQKSIDNLLLTCPITVIVIAHRLSTIKNCGRIIVLSGGKIMEEGKHEDLLRVKGVYFELVQKQMN